MDRKIKVLMLGPARTVKGGMTSVVDNYYKYGLNKDVDIKYVETCNDKSAISKIFKEINGFFVFMKNVKKYEIIHIHMASRRSTFRKLFYLNIAKKYNKKVILHIHGGSFKDFYNCLSKKKKSYIVKSINKANRIVVLSEEWYDYFKNLCNPSKIEIIYNGVDIPSIKEKSFEKNNIIFMGRINQQKGIYDLLEVVRRLKDKENDFCLYIAGTGESKKIKETIEQLDISGNVKLLGWIDDVDKQKYLNKSQYFILPSYYEGMPMSLLEAMSFGCVSIASKVGGIPKIIKDNENGFLIKPGDIEKMEIILNKLFKTNNKKIKKEISKNAIKTINNKFNINNSISKILEIYLSV